MTNPTTGHAPVNGLQLYYEIHGAGDPLIVLHGAIGDHEMYGANLAGLAAHRQVIAVDLQAHGRTADIDRPLSFAAMADDIAGLIDHLGLRTADVMGYSLGGGVAIQTAIRHRARVRRLIVVSSVWSRSAWFPGVRAGLDAVGPALAEPMKHSPVYAHHRAVAPRPDDFAVLLTKLGALVQQDYDWTADVAALPPTLIVAGDADGMQLSHLVDVFARLGGGLHDPGWDGSAGRPPSQLAILPGFTHYDIVSSPVLGATVERFLATPGA